jgi:hypothetical protein
VNPLLKDRPLGCAKSFNKTDAGPTGVLPTTILLMVPSHTSVQNKIFSSSLKAKLSGHLADVSNVKEGNSEDLPYLYKPDDGLPQTATITSLLDTSSTLLTNRLPITGSLCNGRAVKSASLPHA